MNNRPIKFRAYDTKNNKWLTAVPSLEYLLNDEDECVSHHDIDLESAIYSYPHNLIGDTFDDRIIWQQYTGLKDSTGKEIYEGDIVKILIGNEIIGEIIFEYGALSIKDKKEDQYLLCFAIEKKIEIIGNIFETPELLA